MSAVHVLRVLAAVLLLVLNAPCSLSSCGFGDRVLPVECAAGDTFPARGNGLAFSPYELKSVAANGILPVVDSVKPVSDGFRVMTADARQSAYSVGSISESASVGRDGSSSVNVDIEIPSDPHGFTPKVSLAYNSLGSAGNMGWGWSLAGASFISRRGKTFYYDGTTSALCRDDRENTFYIDGVRLMQVGIAENRIEYKSVRGNILATGYLSGNTISFFSVRYPNGVISLFAQCDRLGFYQLMANDALNNNVSYTYERKNAGLQLTDISYNKERYHVSFEYASHESSSGVPFVYSEGDRRAYDNLLDRVTVSVQGNVVRTYHISYKDNDGVLQVDTICCRAGTSELPPLHFVYGNGNDVREFGLEAAQLDRTFPFDSPSELTLQRVKFKYGSLSDGLVVYPNFISNCEYWRNHTGLRHSQDYFFNMYSETQEIIVACGTGRDFVFSRGSLQTGKGFQGILCADVDGEAGDEVVRLNEYVEDGKDYTDITAYAPGSNGGLVQVHSFRKSFNNQLTDKCGNNSIIPKTVFAGDFNGDGINELLAVTPDDVLSSGLKSRLYVISMATGKTLYEADAPFAFSKKFPKIKTTDGSVTVSPENAEYASDKLLVYDVDGDGKTDIVLIGSDGTHTYSFDTSGSAISGCRQIGVDTQLTVGTCSRRKVLIADVNGDNRPDIFLSPTMTESTPVKYVGGYRAYFTKGDGGYELRDMHGLPDYADGQTTFFEDVNHDGTSDYVVYLPATGMMTVSLFKNGAVYGRLKYDAGKNLVLAPADIASYGKVAGMMALGKGGVVRRLAYKGNGLNNLLMAGYTNGYGVTKEFKYRYLHDSSAIKGENARFPYVNYNGPLVMATGYMESAPCGLVRSLDYDYENAVVHRQGLGFRGYERIYTYDRVTGDTQTDVYDVFKEGLLLSSSNNRETRKNTYDYTYGTNNVVHSLLGKSVVENHVDGLTTTATYKYDQYDNILSKFTDYGGGYTKTDTYSYVNMTDSTGRYLIGQPVEETCQTCRGGVVSQTRSTFERNGALLLRKNSYVGGDNLASTASYEYDGNGMKTKVTVSSFGSSVGHTTTFSYDDNGLLAAKTGEDGNTQEYVYDVYDRVVGIKDYVGTTTMGYDDWGNLSWTRYPDGREEKNSRNWHTLVRNCSYYSVREATGKPQTITFFDALGRNVREGRMNYSGKYVYVDRKYNDRGLLASVSDPYVTSAPRWTSIAYDSFDRVRSVVKPSGSKTEYAYSKLSQKCTENGKTTERRFNELGDLMSVESASGSVVYEYNADGSVSRMTPAGGTPRNFDYDQYGRCVRSADAVTGTKDTFYDDEGRVGKECRNSHDVVSYDYDSQGRVVRKTYSDMDVVYEYDQYGNLVSERKSDGSYAKSYVYDDFRRLSRTVTTGNDGMSLTLDFTYADGNLSSTRYTTGLGTSATVSYNYSNGVMTSAVLDGNKVIWRLESEDGQGRARKYSSLGVTTSYGYDDANGTLSSISTCGKDSAVLFNEAYRFDPLTGNLQSRVNNHGWSESFEYDATDRLTRVNGQTVTYDDLGNITENSEVGRFGYGTDNPYAVTEFTPYFNYKPYGDQIVEYNMLNKPVLIDEGLVAATFDYGTDGQRSEMRVYGVGTLALTRYYFGSTYEVDVSAEHGLTERLYLLGDAYSAPVVLVVDDWKPRLYSITRDYLGSIRCLFDEEGQLVQELSYDAWGNLRDPSSGNPFGIGEEPVLLLGRGYTGHEHLAMFGLINMNGRLYDPIVGRFLNADPVLQNPQDAQNFNYYSYVLNNPLKYTDQSGEFLGLVFIGALVGAYIGGSIANHNANPLKWDWGKGSTYIGMALGGVAGAGAGLAVASGLMSVSVVLSTPFLVVGFEFGKTPGSDMRIIDYGYATAAGGGWSHGEQVANDNAGKAYDEAVNTARDIMNVIDNDLSTHPISSLDIMSETMDYMKKHPEDFSCDGYYDNRLNYYMHPSSAPEGVKLVKIKDLTSKVCGGIGKGCAFVGFVLAGYDIYKTSKSDMSQREKYINNGAAIGELVGGSLGCKAAASLTAWSGPLVVGFAIIGGYLGSGIGRQLGGIVGGFVYDIHNLKELESKINEYGNFQSLNYYY